MKIVRVVAVVLAGLVLLAAVATAGYAVGRAQVPAPTPLAAPTATRDPCAAEVAAYANAGSSSDSRVFLVARDDYQKCRQRYP